MSINTHILTLSSLWILSAFFDYLAVGYLWQLKEYRWDRFKDFVSTKQGQQTFLSYRFLWRALLGLVLYTAFSHVDSPYWIFYIILGIDILFNTKEIAARRIRRPTFTSKALVVIASSILIEAILILNVLDAVRYILLIVIFRLLIASVVVLLSSVPTRLLKYVIIYRATKKLSKFRKKITVIGITGSYGKTTIKEFTANILSNKYKVVKTPRNTNTDIGVAKYILQTNFSECDVFVVEMGAYKMGEIKKICDIVHPDIGILSAINEQHLTLFGSIENIQQAKYELLRAIKPEGFVITNADNPHCTELLNELACKKIETFGTEPDSNPNFLILDIASKRGNLSFEAEYRSKKLSLVAPVHGAHQAFNIAASYMAAAHIGMSSEEIKDAISELKNESDTALSIYSYGECTIIDDSYNSNPDGFKAALAILNSQPSSQKRIVITRGMVELGDKSKELHQEIGEEIAFCADELIVINPDSVQHLREGVEHLKGKFDLKIEAIFDEKELLERVKALKQTHSAILLESRIPSRVYKEIKNT